MVKKSGFAESKKFSRDKNNEKYASLKGADYVLVY